MHGGLHSSYTVGEVVRDSNDWAHRRPSMRSNQGCYPVSGLGLGRFLYGAREPNMQVLDPSGTAGNLE